MDEKPFAEVDHTADWALQVHGISLAQLLEHAAQGMIELMGVEGTAGPGQGRTLHLKAPDPESLLVSWLEELLVRMELSPISFHGFRVRTHGTRELDADFTEVPRRELKKMIKAVTYHDLHVTSDPGAWQTTVVFDV